MKRVVFPISILILLFTAGCPPTGSVKGSTLPAPTPTPATDCPPPAAATRAAMPASTPWAGQRLQRPTAAPGRAFLYLATKEATVYSVVIVDGGAVTARFDLDPNGLQDLITRLPDDDGGATTLSPVVKVGGPPRPLQFVVPAPERTTAEDPAYWIRLACLAAGADAHAGGGSASSDK